MADQTFKLSKRVRILSKFLGYESAFSLTGSKKLGQGAFGSVYSTKGAAVKVARTRGKEALENEIKMLQQTKGISVAPKLLGKGKGFAAIQKFEGNTLWDSLTRIKEDPVFADYIFRKLVESVGALHRKNIAHRDLHAGNIFITNDYQVKILDYGQALKKSAAAYYEAIFGGNYDPRQGALGLVGHSFQNTQSYKTYNRILHNTVKTICKLVGADPKIIFTDYADIEGDEKKETIYFDELQKITSLPDGSEKNIITLLYNALDTALKINTKNPTNVKGKIISKTSLLRDNKKTARLINRTPIIKGDIFKAETGGVVPGSGKRQVELHGTEVVIPANKNLPEPPDGILDPEKPWHLPMPKSPGLWGTLKARLTGRPNEYGNYSSYVNISEADADKLIANMKKDPRGYPQLDQSTGTPSQWMDRQRIYQEWLVESYLPRKKVVDAQIYTPADKFIDDQKEFVSEQEQALENALEETSQNIMDAIDELIRMDEEKYEEFKRKLREKNDVEEEEEEQEEDVEEDDLQDIPDELDNLLDSIINDAEEEVEQEEEIPEGLDDLIDSVVNEKKESSYASNKKILNFLTTHLTKIESELSNINDSIIEQNSLLRSSIDIQLTAFNVIFSQEQIIGEKFDRIAEAIENQNKLSQDLAKQQQRAERESQLEQIKDTASTVGFTDLTQTKKKKRESKIGLYFKRKLGRILYRRLPKKLRSARTRVRKLQKLPGKQLSRAAQGISSKLPGQASKVLGGIRSIKSSGGLTAATRRLPGLRYAFAGMEYAERKAAGQSEVQALAGTGAGLLGAAAAGAAGAKAGTMLGATIGAAFGGVGAAPGAAIGAVLGGVLGLAGGYFGGNLAAGAADKATGANQQFESGGVAKTGPAILHGTEAVIPGDQSFNSIDPVGGTILAATSQYINKVGPAAQSIAPLFKQIATPLTKIYDVPTTLVQTNVGGAFPTMESTLKKVKEKKKLSPEDELSAIEKDLLETTNPESFAEKLLNILDPEGKFQQLLKQFNRTNPVGETGEGMATFGESGIDKGTGYNTAGWVHGHFQNSNKQALITDTLEVVKRLLANGTKTVITATNKDLTKEMSDDELRKHIEAGVDGHKKYGSGVFAIDVSVPTGTKVPFELENVYDSNGPGGIVGTMKGKTTQIMHLAPGSKAGAAPTPAPTKPSGPMPAGVSANEISNISDTRDPSKLIIGAGHVDTPGKAGSGQGTAAGGVRESAATQHMLRAIQGLVLADPTLKDKVSFASFNNDNFARDNANRYTNQGMQFLELHFDQRGGGGRSGLIPSRNARAGVTGNAGTSGFDVALSKAFGNYGSNFKRGDLGIPDTGGSILELGAIDSNPKLLQEIKSGTMGPETMKLAQYTYQALRQGAAQEGWLNSATPVPQRNPSVQTMNLKGTSEDKQFVIINSQSKPQNINLPGGNNVSFVPMSPGRWRSQSEVTQSIISKIRLYYQ